MASSDQTTLPDLDSTLALLKGCREGLVAMATQLIDVEMVLRQFRDQQPQPGHEPRGGAECGRHGGPCATGHQYDESCQLDPPGSDRALYIEDVREERPSDRAIIARNLDQMARDSAPPLDLTQFRTPPLTLADTDEQVEEI